MTIIFAGGIGRCATGGAAWQDLQYLLGQRALGHEVYYVEDCGDTSWVYDWNKQEWTAELTFPASFVSDSLAPFGFDGKWIYRTNTQSEGMPLDDFKAVCARADLLIVRAIPLWTWRKEYDLPKRRVFIDVDPGFTQIFAADSGDGFRKALSRYNHLFTIAQRMGEPDCAIPINSPWLKTVTPVYLPEWPYAKDTGAMHFTSIMNWRGFHDVIHNGVAYGQKDKEFPKFFELPRRSQQPFRIAVNGGPEILSENGWEVVSGEAISRTLFSYREFIQDSRAEFGVAKHGYVLMRGGWFSDRSVCYLASGRPILIQDTGLSDWLPVGEGIVTFRDLSEAIVGIEKINADYDRHRCAARSLAEKYFATDRVLPAFLEAAMS